MAARKSLELAKKIDSQDFARLNEKLIEQL